MKKIRCIFVPFLAMLIFCATNAFAAKTELQSIRHIVSAPGQEEVHLQFSASAPDPQEMILNDNGSSRIVLDFPDTSQKKSVANSINTQGNIVQRIRVGIRDGGKVRVVFDLSSLEGVKRDIKYNESSRIMRIQFTGAKADAGANKEQTRQADTQSEAHAGSRSEPLKHKKHSAIAIQPAPTAPATNDAPAPDISPETQRNEVAEQTNIAQTEPSSPESSASAIAPPSIFAAMPLSDSSIPPAEVQEAIAQTQKNNEETAQLLEKTKQLGDKPFLEAVSLDHNSPKGELVIFKLNGFYPPRVQGADQNIPLVICDFDGMQGNEEIFRNPITPDKGRYVSLIRLRQQRNPDKIQAIVELKSGKNYDLQQFFFREENIFALIINETRK